MRMTILLLMIGFITTSCFPTTPPRTMTSGAESVRIGRDNPPEGMTEIGPIEGTDGHGCGGFGERGTYDNAVIALKNEAVSLGATYVQILMVTEPHSEGGGCFRNKFVIRGMAYR